MAELHEYQSNLVKDAPEAQAKKEAWKDTFVPPALRSKFRRSGVSSQGDSSNSGIIDTPKTDDAHPNLEEQQNS